jgi:Hint domain
MNMTNVQENPGAQRTRRNIVKAAPILASAVAVSLATTKGAFAGQNDQGQNNQGQNDNNQGQNGGGRANCFLKGTKILTAEGERKVEDLAIGDLLPTMFGGLRPVQWIGRYPIKRSDPTKPWVKDALPVRVARSALAPNVPHSDLYVTRGHSLLIDGVLVPAEVLINGTTITRYEAREYDELEFFHVKLESHDVIYAEGAPAETLLNVEESAVNFAEYLRQYGTTARDEDRCAPHIHIWGGRIELMSRVRSALSPWIDLRNQAEVVRDQLEECEYVSSSEPEIAV